MPALDVLVQDTAADTDALAGTDLETIPFDGLLQVWQASTVNTATVTIVAGRDNVARSQVIPLIANGIARPGDDPPVFEGVVTAGVKPIVNIGGTTGTVHTHARLTPADEL